MKDNASAGDGEETRRNKADSEHSSRRREEFAAHVFATHLAAMLAITRVHFALTVSPEGSLPLAGGPRK